MIVNRPLTITNERSKVVFYDYAGVAWKNPEVKLFKIRFSHFQNKVNTLLPLLSINEVKRANRYHFKKDRDGFVIRRAILKLLLAEKTGGDISVIDIKKDKNEKPYLASNTPIFFNISHTDDCALIAIADSVVGIDVEKIDPSFSYGDVLDQVFTDLEINQLLGSELPLNTFYTYWTRKEAIVKATGTGIDGSIKKIPSLDGNHLIHYAFSNEQRGLTVKSFEFDPEYSGSLAYSNGCDNFHHIVCFELNPTASIFNMPFNQ